MHSGIKIVHDSRRGCGWRTKIGALYFFTENSGLPCSVLPLELKPCPHCAAMGLRCRTVPTRGFTWIDPSRLFDWKNISCDRSRGEGLCRDCSMSVISRLDHVGLIWVGEKFYASPDDFIKEARQMGISRRIPHNHIPKGFKIGEDFIMLAHKKSVLRVSDDGKSLMDYYPGVFGVFRPQSIQVLCSGEESDEVIESYLERGLTPIKVERNG